MTRLTILVIQDSKGTPTRHLEVQESNFIEFRVHLGSFLGVNLETFLRFVCDWGSQMGDGFQVHVFHDPEVEMLLESGGCMCYNHSKNKCF